MIKTEIKSPQKNEPIYPIIARHNEDKGLVVLFDTKTSGVVISENSSYWRIGSYSKTWIQVFDKNEWEILPKGTKVIFTVE